MIFCHKKIPWDAGRIRTEFLFRRECIFCDVAGISVLLVFVLIPLFIAAVDDDALAVGAVILVIRVFYVGFLLLDLTGGVDQVLIALFPVSYGLQLSIAVCLQQAALDIDGVVVDPVITRAAVAAGICGSCR